MAGYDGFGRQSGWVTAHGERFALDRAVHRGTRDHHWGTRDGVGGPALWSGNQHPHSGEWVEFEEYGVWGDHVLYNLGDPRRGSDTLRGRRHRLRFEPDTHLLLSGEVDLVFADGTEKTMTFERLGNQIAFLRCGMYGGPNGGTPDGDIWHGMDVGDGVVSGETYDANDPAVRSRICGLDQHHARFECEGEVTYGIIEPYDTLCYEMASSGLGGFSLLDVTVHRRPGLTLTAPGFFLRPDYFEVLAPLRRHSPVHRTDDGLLAVSRYEDVRAISRDPTRFVSGRGVLVNDPLRDPEGTVQNTLSILHLDPPLHAAYRTLVNRQFTPRAVDRLADSIRRA